MPTKYSPAPEQFRAFSKYMIREGFRLAGAVEFIQDRERLGLKSSHPYHPGRTIGFSFTANHLTIRTWTTVEAATGRIKEKCNGWVLMLDGDDVVWYSRPLNRTRWFLRRLYRLSVIRKHQAENRPLCQKCGRLMKVERGRALKSRYWICKSYDTHDDNLSVREGWDFGLPDADKKYLEGLRRKRRQNKKHQAKTATKPAVLRRKGWKIGRPENKVSITP